MFRRSKKLVKQLRAEIKAAEKVKWAKNNVASVQNDTDSEENKNSKTEVTHLPNDPIDLAGRKNEKYDSSTHTAKLVNSEVRPRVFDKATDTTDLHVSNCDRQYELFPPCHAKNKNKNVSHHTGVSYGEIHDVRHDNNVELPDKLLRNLHNIRTFSGIYNENRNLYSFFRELEVYVKIHLPRNLRQWYRDAVLIQLLEARLTDDALLYFDTLNQKDKISYYSAKRALLIRFGYLPSVPLIYNKLNNIKQHNNMSVPALRHEIVKWVNIYVNESMGARYSPRKDHIIAYLCHDRFCKALRRDIFNQLVLDGIPQNFEALVEKAQHLEDAFMIYRNPQSERQRFVHHTTPSSLRNSDNLVVNQRPKLRRRDHSMFSTSQSDCNQMINRDLFLKSDELCHVNQLNSSDECPSGKNGILRNFHYVRRPFNGCDLTIPPPRIITRTFKRTNVPGAVCKISPNDNSHYVRDTTGEWVDVNINNSNNTKCAVT